MTISAEPVFRPISPFGAEASGIDLAAGLDDALRSRLRDALDEHTLLLFRDQTLSKERLPEIAEIFGSISDQGINPGSFTYLEAWLDVPDKHGHAVAGEALRARADGPLAYHSDGFQHERPPKAVMLYGVRVPPEGGETIFADVRRLFERLPVSTQRRMENLTIRHRAASGRVTTDHPLLLRHPRTGAPVVCCSKLHALGIPELPEAEGNWIIEEIVAHVDASPKLQHKWSARDLVVWDNLSLQHRRTAFDRSYERLLAQLWIH